MATSIKQALGDARHRLQATSASPATDASVLLCHVLNCAASDLIAWPDRLLSTGQLAGYNDAIRQRVQGKPVAYITGEKEFWSLRLQVNADVLIPRPETETLVEFVLETFADRTALEVVDLGTGSGAIACALANERPDWNIAATDASAAALGIARTNASSHGLTNIRFMHGHWFEPVEGLTFDLIVSNPPYVADKDEHLNAAEIRFEPAAALTAGEHGMDAIAHLTRYAGLYLRTGGWLVIEHGYDQQQAAYACFDSAGFCDVVQLSDLAGQPRITAGRYPGAST